MNQPLRIGLVGAGMVSRHHLIAWANIADQARIVAVADPCADNAARRADEFKIPQTYASAETAPPDNLETLRLVEDCYRLSGWEALQ
jgi:predicted dehydrogenase